jgi:hypothetical protein
MRQTAEVLTMNRLFPVLTAAVVLAGGSLALGQQPTNPTPAERADSAAERTKSRAKDAASNEAVTHGTIKEFTPGQKVVVAVDNAPDKTFDLTDKDVKVTIAKTLKVGDTVKVAEHSVMGKTKRATITKAAASATTAK